jgi:hypothetical protein
VDFLHIHAKNPDYPACFGSLQGKNRLTGDFWDFMREAQQTAKPRFPMKRKAGRLVRPVFLPAH